MRLRKFIAFVLVLAISVGIFACSKAQDSFVTSQAQTSATTAVTTSESQAETTLEATSTPTPIPTINPEYIGLSAEEICDLLTIEEKAAQMVQGAIYNLNRFDMAEVCYGSVLSTNGNWPANTCEQWNNIIRRYQAAALSTSTGIPFVYGNDSVHGVNTTTGCVIFPHNINVGAANNEELTYEMGVAVGSDVLHTQMIWNFAPCIAVSNDPRWGRTYECFSSDIEIVTNLGLALNNGMMSEGVITCPKHFFCDGYAAYGTGEDSGGVDRIIDRGDAIVSDDVIQANLDMYQQFIDAGAQTIMISHTALNGVKMHEYAEYIMMLKDEMGFTGFIVSDWDSLENCSGADLEENVILAVNAGIDMLMESSNYEECRQIIIEAVNDGRISMERIDDAVTRILRVKIDAGLFEDPYLENLNPTYEWYSTESQDIAREMAASSLVPIKDDIGLTIEEGSRVFVCGPASDDTGALCGGWTYTWEGSLDSNGLNWCPTGTSILTALENIAEEYNLTIVTDPEEISTCDLVLLCVGEITYAEWTGDTEDLSITGSHGIPGNLEAIELANESGLPTITLITSGRNVIISEYIDNWDSVIMCYWPGSEGGEAIASCLVGEHEYTGTLPMPFYESVEDIDNGIEWLPQGYSAVN